MVPLAVALREIKIKLDLPPFLFLSLLLALLRLHNLLRGALFCHDLPILLNLRDRRFVEQCFKGFRNFADKSKPSTSDKIGNIAPRCKVRPEQFERRARLVSAVARGRRWLDDVVSGRVTTVAELCAREKCSIRQVNMTISLAFLAPNLVKAALEGRLPRGIGIERLRDPPTEWSRQFEALGLNPE